MLIQVKQFISRNTTAFASSKQDLLMKKRNDNTSRHQLFCLIYADVIKWQFNLLFIVSDDSHKNVVHRDYVDQLATTGRTDHDNLL